jgi:hypothetical protein
MVDTSISTPLQPLVISHSPCIDGFTAAWAMWLKYPDAEFVPGVYGQDPPDCTGRDVYLLDFSYKRAVMEKICAEAKSVLVLDHHKSAQEDLAGLDNWLDGDTVNVCFNMEKSGARLAWEYFHPGKIAPRLIAHVEDRDLWRYALFYTREINAALFSYDYDFTTWSRISSEMEGSSIDGPVGLDRFITEGRAILRKQDKDIRELIGKTMSRRRIGGTMVPCANLPYTLASDSGNLMALDAPFAATWWADAVGWFNFSLRSVEGGYDVSDVAKAYGGGGHKHAAGFRVKSLEEL